MKKVIGFSVMAAVLATSVSAFAGITQREAQVAKERLARCQYNDAVCAANVVIDALSNDRPEQFPGGNNSGANNGNTNQVLIMYYSNSDTCNSGLVSTTTVLNQRDVQGNIEQCNRLSAVAGGVWSIKIGGTCVDIPDTNVKGACMEAVNRLATQK